MASKSIFIVAQALFIQMSLAQVIYPGSTFNGNSVVDNIAIGGLGSSFGNLGNSFGSLGNSFGSLGNSFGSGLSSGFGSGMVSSGFGNLGSTTAGAISSGVLAGLGGYNVVPGGPLAVTTISPIGPSGLAIASENAIEGILTVNGQLPYLSAVAFEGALQTSGSGVATCGCGSGNVGIVSEGFGQGGLGAANYGLGAAGLGLGQSNLGFGNRVLY